MLAISDTLLTVATRTPEQFRDLCRTNDIHVVNETELWDALTQFLDAHVPDWRTSREVPDTRVNIYELQRGMRQRGHVPAGPFWLLAPQAEPWAKREQRMFAEFFQMWNGPIPITPQDIAVYCLPVVLVTRHDFGNGDRYRVDCPFCYQTHIHGADTEEGKPAPGWRVAHCRKTTVRSYYLIEQPILH